MIPVKTEKTNFIATGYEHPAVGCIRDLAIYMATDGALYSTWYPSLWERVKMIFGAPIVIGVLSKKQPPMTVQAGHGHVPGWEEEWNPGGSLG